MARPTLGPKITAILGDLRRFQVPEEAYIGLGVEKNTVT